MGPAMYLLLEGPLFVVLVDPGAMAIYPQWAAPTTIKMIVQKIYSPWNWKCPMWVHSRT
jgi:hypothetical protein